MQTEVSANAMTAYSLGGGWPINRWLELFERTRAWLRAQVAGESLTASDRDYVAASTLTQIDAMRDGCRLLVRVDRSGQWRACLRPADLTPVHQEAGYRVPPQLRMVTGNDLATWRQAAAVFGSIPAMPGDAVTYPGPVRSYASIPVPRGPADALDRLEELERTIWGFAVPGQAQSYDPEPVRRTYAFFDAGYWLVRSLLGQKD